MNVWILKLACVAIAITGVGALFAGEAPKRDSADPDKVARSSLTYHDLFSPNDPEAPTGDDAFAIPANAALPGHSFEGRLDLLSPESNGTFEVLRDDFHYLKSEDRAWKHLPNLSIEFVQDGSHLIPVRQGLIITGNTAWNYIVGPGRVWQEQGDNGYSRASFPFTLVERNQNCTHNGLMTFLYATGRNRNISKVRYQITQETCLYFKFNLWGQISPKFTLYRIKNSRSIRQKHATELQNRLRTKPFSELAADYRTAGVDLGAFTKAFRAPEHITLYGLFVNGVNYVSNCPTRTGEYPFCEHLRLPSYSTAKSSFASVVMMRLGALYGPGVYRELIRNYLPEHVKGGDWTSVTFDHALDMATGNYISVAYLADENGDKEGIFIVDEPYAKRIGDAFAFFPHKSAPGTTFVYQSHATFIVTQAMDAYLKRQRGPHHDLFELLRDDVFKPMKFNSGSLSTLRTDNTDKITSTTGKPFGSHGLFYIYDDVAKLAKLLNNDKGKIDGLQILDPVRVRTALFRNPHDLGLPVIGGWARPDTYRYKSAFWGKKMTHAEFPQDYSCDFWVARMGGYGGINIVLMPNGITYYIFSDHNEFVWYDAVREANKLVPLCNQRESRVKSRWDLSPGLDALQFVAGQ